MVATGRESGSTRPVFDALDGAVDYAIMANGGMVKDADWRTIRQKWVPASAADRVMLSLCEVFGDKVAIDLDFDAMYWDSDTRWLDFMNESIMQDSPLIEYYQSITHISPDGVAGLRRFLHEQKETARITIMVAGKGDAELIEAIAPTLESERRKRD